jgi:hypothetical protein
MFAFARMLDACCCMLTLGDDATRDLAQGLLFNVFYEYDTDPNRRLAVR